MPDVAFPRAPVKMLHVVGTSREDLCQLPESARETAGSQLLKRATVIKGSGNIFRDLGFSEEGSAALILKSRLLQALQRTIRARAWKQAGAATRLGIDQGKVSKLLAGQMAGFSVERLVHFLSLLGQDVEVTVRRARRGQRYGTVRAKGYRRSRTFAVSRSKKVP